jgi:predicted DNA-binding transcriptional regulator YafY
VEDQFDYADLQVGEDGSVLASFALPEDEWVYGMILSYGPTAEVLEPDRVRRIIAERAEQIVALYQS